MTGGVVIVAEQGTPQGANLSPLLANIMLGELDRELKDRGLNFADMLMIQIFMSEAKRQQIGLWQVL